MRFLAGGSTVLSCCGRFDKARCPFSAIAVCRRCSRSFEKRRQRRFGPRGRPLQDPVGSGSERIELVKLLYAFSTRRLRWVRKHGSPGATRHSIHGLDVYASRPRATAAMRQRFHGATARGAICGTQARTASERARPTGAGRSGGTNARKPKARDGGSSARAWPTSLTTKRRRHGASICGRSSARRRRSIGSC